MNMKKRLTLAMALLTGWMSITSALAASRFIAYQPEAGAIRLAGQGQAAYITIDDKDDDCVHIAARNLAEDFARVCGTKAAIGNTAPQGTAIVVGTYGKSQLIDELVRRKVLAKEDLKGKREKYIITHAKGTDGQDMLVIAGSDRRGTVYGIYELSEQMGVSPWYWWADVPVQHREAIYARPGQYTDGEPAVQYRGIFINDEWPAFGRWAKEKFGDLNSKMYAHMYELILRLKGNFLWPAMWASAFYEDDPENSRMADRMGIIIGTSHHEPMARNHQEYARRRKVWGPWNYVTNQENLDRFFSEGIARIKDTEDVVTIGMRGDGDTAMGKDADISLLERIVKNQRDIIRKVTGKPANKTPQVWALYKEVQEYYEKGMSVPDDVILLLCDDNWGNVRLLPELGGKHHKGGYGMYYHVDYVGGPRNTKWINVSQIQRIWEQMSLTYEYGVDRMWILNVGDLKPMEFPIDFFLRMAWAPRRYEAGNLMAYTEDFCRSIFGEEQAPEAARILNLQGMYAHRCTAEMLSPKTYSLYTGEWAQVVADYKRLEADALNQFLSLNPVYADTYRQLILFPVQAMSNMYDLNYAYAMNRYLAEKGSPEANVWADRAYQYYVRDSLLCAAYNKEISGGKWNHMMDQLHIGYTSWNEPKHRYFPEPTRVTQVYEQGNGQELPDYRGCLFESGSDVTVMEAEHYFCLKHATEARWTLLPHFGKTVSGIAVMPYTQSTQGAEVEYRFKTPQDMAQVRVTLYLAPSFPFNGNRGQRIRLAADHGEPVEININHKQDNTYEWQAERINRQTVTLPVAATGSNVHTLHLQPLDPGVVVERIRIDNGKAPHTYLGGQESMYSVKAKE